MNPDEHPTDGPRDDAPDPAQDGAEEAVDFGIEWISKGGDAVELNEDERELHTTH